MSSSQAGTATAAEIPPTQGDTSSPPPTDLKPTNSSPKRKEIDEGLGGSQASEERPFTQQEPRAETVVEVVPKKCRIATIDCVPLADDLRRITKEIHAFCDKVALLPTGTEEHCFEKSAVGHALILVLAGAIGDIEAAMPNKN